jgi:hypothetical protein
MIVQQENEDYSVFYYVKSVFDPLGIPVVDEFPATNLIVPCVSVEVDDITPFVGEMGNVHRVYRRVYFIDFYAKNKAQRQQMGYIMMHALELAIPVFDYNGGFPPESSPSQIGCLQVEDIRMRRILVAPELVSETVSKFYYRSIISFETYFNKL